MNRSREFRDFAIDLCDDEEDGDCVVGSHTDRSDKSVLL